MHAAGTGSRRPSTSRTSARPSCASSCRAVATPRWCCASWAAHIEGNEEWLQLVGTEGGVRNDPPVRYRLDGGEQLTEPLEDPTHAPGCDEAIAHFVDCVRGDASPLVTPEETLNVQRILDGMYDSAASGREVRFD